MSESTSKIGDLWATIRRDLDLSKEEDPEATELVYVECDTCRAKPGSPILCGPCLERRSQHSRTGRCRPPLARPPASPPGMVFEVVAGLTHHLSFVAGQAPPVDVVTRYPNGREIRTRLEPRPNPEHPEDIQVVERNGSHYVHRRCNGETFVVPAPAVDQIVEERPVTALYALGSDRIERLLPGPTTTSRIQAGTGRVMEAAPVVRAAIDLHREMPFPPLYPNMNGDDFRQMWEQALRNGVTFDPSVVVGSQLPTGSLAQVVSSEGAVVWSQDDDEVVMLQIEQRVQSRMMSLLNFRQTDEHGNFHMGHPTHFELPGGPLFQDQLLDDEIVALERSHPDLWARIQRARSYNPSAPLREARLAPYGPASEEWPVNELRAILERCDTVREHWSWSRWLAVSLAERERMSDAERAEYVVQLQRLYTEGRVTRSLLTGRGVPVPPGPDPVAQAVAQIAEEEDSRILAELMLGTGLPAQTLDIRDVRPQGEPIATGGLTRFPLTGFRRVQPTLAGYDQFVSDAPVGAGPIPVQVPLDPPSGMLPWDGLSPLLDLTAPPVGVMSSGPVPPLSASELRALRLAMLGEVWREAFGSRPVPTYDSCAVGLTPQERERLLEAIVFVTSALAEEGSNTFLNMPEYLQTLIRRGAPTVLREMGHIVSAEGVRASLPLTQLEQQLVNRLREEAPSFEKEPRTGVPRGIREYLARRPDQKAAWEKLNGPIPGVPDRFLRMLDDDDIL